MVVRLGGLTVTNNHVIKLKGDTPVVFLINVLVDSGGTIDAGATGTTAGPGGSISTQCGSSTGGAGSSSGNGKAGGFRRLTEGGTVINPTRWIESEVVGLRQAATPPLSWKRAPPVGCS